MKVLRKRLFPKLHTVLSESCNALAINASPSEQDLGKGKTEITTQLRIPNVRPPNKNSKKRKTTKHKTDKNLPRSRIGSYSKKISISSRPMEDRKGSRDVGLDQNPHRNAAGHINSPRKS